MNKPKHQSVTNIVGMTTAYLPELLEAVLEYFAIPCPNENCKDNDDSFLIVYNERIECNVCDDYSTNEYTIKLEFD